MSTSNYIKNVAIVGVSGRSGSHMTEELLKTGKHTVTAITRSDSSSTPPQGVHVAKVNYDDPSTLVAALKGQDALIITMGTMAPPDTQSKLIQAAAEAGVPWVLPNEWGPDTAHPGLQKDVPLFGKLVTVQEEVKKLDGKVSALYVDCGFWYEWSLAIPDSFGVDLLKREATLFDNGEVKMSVSTWAQVGRAVAALLSLPVHAEGGDNEACLDNYRNKNVYINSFTVSQKDMLDSVYRVTGTKESEWKFSKEPSKERYDNAIAKMKGGDRMGFVVAMYTRVFFPDDSGNFEKTKGTANKVLGLPKEDIDEATKVAIERAKTNPWA
ncbi:hypothetical protein LTR78_000190 [Recurvomyces mirabilis]|uniref:NmrA-like domain-containing protein n=1 Tax=Recurvomyces mirabilis TaxID=574656 RepID=A0AAE0WXF9_9PEZI|nr:hypothetical protein LTR78_000190 [Recurvomyces mirabilis]KAK5161847.1 hypothetical protein LTS14_000192 [Recurvomyces mirabilis]